MTDDLKALKQQVKTARAFAKDLFTKRARLLAVLSGSWAGDYDIEFPDADLMHVYTVLFGHRVCDPVVYRLSFGKPLKWVGVSHPWGPKPTDIEVDA